MSARTIPSPAAFLCGWHKKYHGTEQWIDNDGQPVPAPANPPPLLSISHGLCRQCAPLWKRDAGLLPAIQPDQP
jgi:hypothetical protein